MICEHCQRGLDGLDRITRDMQPDPDMDLSEGYGRFKTSQLVVMLVACAVAAQHNTLTVDMSKKLAVLRAELDMRVPVP